MGGPEKNLVNRILRELNSWPRTRAVKIHGSQYGRRGDPDVWVSRYGRMFLLEVKTPGKKPTRAQYAELRKWRETGAIAEWCDSFDGAIAIVRSVLLTVD